MNTAVATSTLFCDNSALFLYDTIQFTMLPAQGIQRDSVSLLDVMLPGSNQWGHALLGKVNFSCFCRYIGTGGEVWENKKCCWNTSQ